MRVKRDPIQETVGFMMNNLKAFPFSRLPRDAQVEVIEQFDVKKKELVNVTSGLRGYFARNGIFGRDVDSIKIYLFYTEEDKSVLWIGSYGFLFHDLLKNRALFRNICSCRYFGLSYSKNRRLEEGSKEDEDVKKIAECFPNLCFVKRLFVDKSWDPSAQELLESFRFKVTELAEFPYKYLNLPESRHWQHLLVNQLSNCEKVIIVNEDWIDEIPGMEIEEDEKKCEEILDAFEEVYGFWRSNYVFQYYRRKITEDKEMLMIILDR